MISIMYRNGELVCTHKWLFAPYGDGSAGVMNYTGFGSLEVASPGVKHNWAAPQPLFPF